MLQRTFTEIFQRIEASMWVESLTLFTRDELPLLSFNMGSESRQLLVEYVHECREPNSMGGTLFEQVPEGAPLRVFHFRLGNKGLVCLRFSLGEVTLNLVGLVHGTPTESFLGIRRLEEAVEEFTEAHQRWADQFAMTLAPLLPLSGWTGLTGFYQVAMAEIWEQLLRLRFAAITDRDGFVLASASGTRKGNQDLGAAAASPLVQLQREMEKLRSGALHRTILLTQTGCLFMEILPEEDHRLLLASDDRTALPWLSFVWDLARRSVEQGLFTLPRPAVPRSRRREVVREWNSWEKGGVIVAPSEVVRSSRGKRFHRPDCTMLELIPDGAIRFVPSRADAVRQGLTPCPKCGA